jgi:hypothetical protein
MNIRQHAWQFSVHDSKKGAQLCNEVPQSYGNCVHPDK